MLRKLIFSTLALGSLLCAAPALAQTPAANSLAGQPPAAVFKPLPVVFPIVQLGGCTSKDECKAYCDVGAHHDACFAYAQTHGLMSTTSIALARKLLSAVGPGGCTGDACKNYCQDSAHEQVCVAFAQQNGFISQHDADARMERLNVASTTRPLPPIPTNSTGTIASSTRPHPDLKAGTINAAQKPPPPPGPKVSGGSGQGGSIFFAVLHFFGL